MIKFSYRFFNTESFMTAMKQHGKHFSTALFIIGFLFDCIYLPEVSHPLTPYIGLLYAIGFGFSLLARSFILTRSKGDVFTNKISNFLSLLLMFFSGSVLSYIFIFYYRSSYVAGAIPFFLFALFVIISNEYIKSKKYRTYLDVSIFYFVLTALSIFLLPFATQVVSNGMFILSLTLATILSLLFSYVLLQALTPDLVKKPIVYALSFWAPCAFTFLYFTNSIPPLPLSITSAKIYQSVVKTDNHYEVTEEVRQGLTTTLHIKEGKPLYFFTTIFAPSLVVAPIEHVWERYDETTSTWKEVSRVTFQLTGGRKDGYRGYSLTRDTSPGKWRVSVYLDNKRLLGRHYFSLESAEPFALKVIER